MSLNDNHDNYPWISRCTKWREGSELSGVNRQLTATSAMWPINSIFFPLKKKRGEEGEQNRARRCEKDVEEHSCLTSQSATEIGRFPPPWAL